MSCPPPPRRGGPGPLPAPEVCAGAVLSAHPSPPASLLQGTSRPARSLSTAQLAQPSGGLQASVISNVVLMKGQAKVSKGRCQQKLLDGPQPPRSCPVQGRTERGLEMPAASVSVAKSPGRLGEGLQACLTCAGHRGAAVSRLVLGMAFPRSEFHWVIKFKSFKSIQAAITKTRTRRLS